MIFKSVLKYKIFEWCLDTLFDKITSNFTKNPRIRNIPRIGEYFSKVEDIEDGCTYYECIVCEYVIWLNGREQEVDTIPEGIDECDIGIGFAFAYELDDGEPIEHISDIPLEDLTGEVIGPISEFIFIK